MSDWRVTTLDNLVRLQRGHDLPTSVRIAGDVPVVGAAGPSGFHDAACAKGPGVVLGRAGASMGHATYCPYDFWPLNTSLYVTDFIGNDPRFVYYLLGQIDFSGFNSGAAQPMLNRNYIKQIPIVLPYPEEQRRISACLGALDDKIAVNDRIAANVDQYCAALFESIVVENSNGTNELGEVADLNAIVVKPAKGGSLRYVDISSVGDGRLTWPRLTSWDEAPGRARRGVSAGDTLWSTVRPNRRSRTLVLDEDSLLVASTGFAVITPRGGGPAFLYESARREEFVAYLESVAEGSAYPAVRAERFLTAPIPDAREEHRDRFETLAFPVRRRAHSASQESRVLTDLRDTLLPELMSGRLRVKDAEKVVEEAV